MLKLPTELRNLIANFCTLSALSSLRCVCKLFQKIPLDIDELIFNSPFRVQYYNYKSDEELIRGENLYMRYSRGKSYAIQNNNWEEESMDRLYDLEDYRIIHYERQQTGDDYVTYTLVLCNPKQYKIVTFGNEVNPTREWTPDYYGWDDDDLDKKVFITEQVVRTWTNLGQFKVHLKHIPNSFRIIDQQIYDNEVYQGKYLLRYRKNYNDIWPHPVGYYSVLVDRCDYMKSLYVWAISGNQIYITEGTENDALALTKQDCEQILSCATLNNIKNIHYGIASVDLIITESSLLLAEKMFTCPDILFPVGLGGTNFPKDYYCTTRGLLRHASKFTSADFVASLRDETSYPKEYFNLTAEDFLQLLSQCRQDNHYQKGYKLVEVVLEHSLISDTIMFEAYIITRCQHGAAKAEELVKNTSFQPSRSRWQINWNFYSDELKAVLESRF